MPIHYIITLHNNTTICGEYKDEVKPVLEMHWPDRLSFDVEGRLQTVNDIEVIFSQDQGSYPNNPITFKVLTPHPHLYLVSPTLVPANSTPSECTASYVQTQEFKIVITLPGGAGTDEFIFTNSGCTDGSGPPQSCESVELVPLQPQKLTIKVKRQPTAYECP